MTISSKIRFSVFMCAILTLLIACKSPGYDMIIRNGIVHVGEGKAGISADIGISGNQIMQIAKTISGTAPIEIDAKGMVVAPGFIDLHAHIEPITLYPEAESFIRQGVTTTLGGPDGGSPLPIGKYLDSLSVMGVGINTAYLVGHNTVRNHVMGLENRVPTSEELAEMQHIIEESMESGAFGISTGLKYLPGTYSKTDEVIAVSKAASKHGGIYTSHLRDEGLKLLDGVAEAILISEQADIPVVLTHHKAIGQPMWGASIKTLAMVDSARAAGLDIMIDQYPYTASFTSISVLIPPWSMEGDRYLKFAERCKDPVLRDSIKNGITYNIKYDRGGNDLRRIQLATFNWKPEFVGKTLYDWAISEGMEPTAENGAELVIQAQLHRGASCIYHVMDEADVERIMQHPQTMHASDGRLSIIHKGHPHPRAFGTFPRVLGYYVREKGVLSLEEAIRKMTSMPAARIGLTDRGLLKEGYKADITIFDPETVVDKATFEDPNQFPEGINYVIVNGQIALENGSFKNARFGEVLRKK